jgi:hypothetical protein
LVHHTTTMTNPWKRKKKANRRTSRNKSPWQEMQISKMYWIFVSVEPLVVKVTCRWSWNLPNF